MIMHRFRNAIRTHSAPHGGQRRPRAPSKAGITPVINTGIAHRKAGIGQVGAGTVHPPISCFEQALEALAAELGIAA